VQVERTDFLSVPVTNIERSRRFYRETLGIEEIVPDNSFPEFQLGENVSLYLIDPTKVGRDFEGPSRGAIAVRVPDVTAARAELESKGSSSAATRSTPVSATWPSSPIPTATS
jgi:catechol 2,3-dioxygenase-like lactoylglutathione lyase family enzyme